MRDVYVAVVGMVHDGRNQYHNWIPTRTKADGRFHVRGLRPDLSHVVLVKRDGWATVVYHLPKQDAKGVRDAGVIRMREPRLLLGRITDWDNKPIVGLKVGLWGTNEDRSRLTPGAKKELPASRLVGWGLLRSYVAMRKVQTDADGRFGFGDLAQGNYDLVVYDERNRKIANHRGIRIAADADPDSIKLSIDR